MIWYNKLIPFKGFIALNLFGLICIREEYREYLNEFPWRLRRTLNHESVHTAQQKETLYVGFYIIYLLEWLFKLFKYRNSNEAYRNIRFEREAYRNEDNLNYLLERKKFAWIHHGKEDSSN